MTSNCFKKLRICLLFFSFAFGLFFCCNANAKIISEDDLYKMSLQTGLIDCYKEYAEERVSMYDLSSYEKFFKTSGNWGKVNGQDVWITTHIGNSLSSHYGDPWIRDSNLSCKQLFEGYGKEAKGLLQIFQFPQITTSNISTVWGYMQEGSNTPTTGDGTPSGNKVKITITDATDSSGANKAKITTEGEIICSGVEGGVGYNWVLNCDGEINAFYDEKKIYTVKALHNNGRKWRVVSYDGYHLYDGWAPNECFSDEECKYITQLWDPNDVVAALQRAANNVYANDKSKKSVLEILNGDARKLQSGDGSLTYRLEKITDSVFGSLLSKPSYNIKVEAVDDGGGGTTTTNYVPILNAETAGGIFSYNLGFDDSLPHSSTTISAYGVQYSFYIWDSTAKYSLYYRYLLNMMKLWPEDIVINGCSENKPTSGYYFKNKKNEWCNINISGSLVNSGQGVGINILNYVVSTAEKSMFRLGEGTFGEVLEWFKKESSYNGIQDDAYANGTASDWDPGKPGSPETEITCANSGAAESLGWILCPLLNVLSNAANDIYNNTVEPMLQIQPELFSQDDNYGTKYAWDVFQNIANIIFVILFLFVIFSQLTGVGIDNYGIKKLLPKLIIAAILINLSYYICLICVDLSNIIGNGLKSMFDNLPLSADGMATSITIAGESGSQSFSIVPTAITGVALLGVLVAGIWAVIANPAILLSLLVSALGVVIAIFFLFILLSARQAAVIVLTVISPVAFVCYLLPNTKKLFDKYIQLGKGLLLLYPICGLLVGGGNYISKLLLSSGFARDNGIAAAFTAMIIGVVPIFFIPSLLKGSFAVLGNLGAKISGFGERIRGGATRGIRNMEGYKRAQERGAEIGTRIRAGYDRNGNKRDVGRFGRFMRGVSRRGMQREALRYQKIVSDRGSLEATEGEDFMLATETANEMKNIVASGEINDMGSMQNSLRDALISGDRAKIRAYTDGLTAKGEDGRVAVKAAYNAAVSSGRMSTDSARTFANNIMANHAADYKNNNRSMFEVARNINTAANPTALGAAVSTTTGSYVGANSTNLAGKVTATTIGNMDDDAFEELFGGYHSKSVTIPAGAAANEIGAAAYTALHDQNANIKAERRRYLEEILKRSGYKADPRHVQIDGGKVDANVTNPVLSVQGTVDVGNEVDVNITQSRGGQVNPVQINGTVDAQAAGTYADSAGNTYRIRKTLDGKYVDDAGFEVDISKFTPR